MYLPRDHYWLAYLALALPNVQRSAIIKTLHLSPLVSLFSFLNEIFSFNLCILQTVTDLARNKSIPCRKLQGSLSHPSSHHHMIHICITDLTRGEHAMP